MSQIRLDFITKRPVIYTTSRENKPNDLWNFEAMFSFDSQDDDVKYDENCPFCTGNEEMTPKSVYKICDENGDIKVRIVPNKYPIIKTDTTVCDMNDFCYFSPGTHDVVIEVPNHNQNYFNIDKRQFYYIYKAIHKRYCDLIVNPSINYVSFFKNYKMFGGASLKHCHSQIISIKAMPIKLNYEINCAKDYYEEKGKCVFCDMIKKELKHKKRLIYENHNFIAIEPYAPAYKFETWILPKKHISSFEDEKDIKDLADVLYTTYKMLYKTLGDFPFNMYLNSLLNNMDSSKKSYHYSFRITPKLTGGAGFEMASGIRVNPVLPEDAARKILKINGKI